jgi:hypothetical protein
VSTDQHDWDRVERQALAGLDDQIDVMRRRHAGDPPIELLRAARGDALPEDLQTSVSEHLAASAMSRTLAEGLGDDGPVLSEAEQERLLARIVKEARKESAPSSAWGWLRPVLVGSGIVAIASLVWMVSKGTDVGERLAPPDTQVVVALPPAAPPFQLAFDKPDVRLGMRALTWRGSSPSTSDDGNQLLADLKPGLDAYRANDYAAANRELTSLASRYPGTIEILFYQGMSRLLLDDYAGAIAAFEAADAVGDRTFASDVAWYRAVAEQRAGHDAQARTRLDAICRARGSDAPRACAALEQLARTSANPR